MTKLCRRCGLFFVIQGFLISAAHAQPSIQNPSFETPVLPSGGRMDQPPGADWIFSSGIVGIASEGNSLAGFSPTLDGTQSAFFSGDTSITQTIGGFTVGQNYRLDWLQNRQWSNSGGIAFRAVLDRGLPTEQVIAPYEVAGAPDWKTRASDVFTATKSSYTLTMEGLDLRQPGYAFRHSVLDALEFQATTDAVTQRIARSATLDVAPTPFTIQVFVGGNPLEPAVTGNIEGELKAVFDYIPGRGIVNIGFKPTTFLTDRDFETTFDFGPLGSVDVTMQNAGIIPYTASEGSIEQRLSVHPDGTFDLQSMFMRFLGQVTYSGEGTAGDLIGSGNLNLADLFAADLGFTTLFDGSPFFPGPGTIELHPTANPDEFLMSVDVPILVVVELEPELGVTMVVSSQLHATNLVRVVPEPSSLALAGLAAMAMFCVAARKKLCLRRNAAPG